MSDVNKMQYKEATDPPNHDLTARSHYNNVVIQHTLAVFNKVTHWRFRKQAGIKWSVEFRSGIQGVDFSLQFSETQEGRFNI